MKIFKYELNPGQENQRISMPMGARILNFQEQHGQLVVWAAVDPLGLDVMRDLSVIGTGWDLPAGNQTYVGTAQIGSLVWHLFDGGEA